MLCLLQGLMEKIPILNIEVLDIARKELLEDLQDGVLVTPNVDHLVKLQSDKSFYDAYRSAEWVVCDSRILYMLSKFLRNPLKETISGSDFFPAYYTYHKDDEDCRIFLLGGRKGAAQKAMANINAKVGRNIVVGEYSPAYGFERAVCECTRITDIVNASGASVLLVGLGAPKQEVWIFKYRHLMPRVRLFMALGATIDFEAGTLKRAPKIWRSLCLEWFYRFIKEPERLFKRYFIDDVRFFGYFGKQLLGIYKNPFQSQS